MWANSSLNSNCYQLLREIEFQCEEVLWRVLQGRKPGLGRTWVVLMFTQQVSVRFHIVLSFPYIFSNIQLLLFPVFHIFHFSL